MTLLIVVVPLALAVLITGWLLIRARFSVPSWLVRKTGEPSSEAAYRYGRGR